MTFYYKSSLLHTLEHCLIYQIFYKEFHIHILDYYNIHHHNNMNIYQNKLILTVKFARKVSIYDSK